MENTQSFLRCVLLLHDFCIENGEKYRERVAKFDQMVREEGTEEHLPMPWGEWLRLSEKAERMRVYDSRKRRKRGEKHPISYKRE